MATRKKKSNILRLNQFMENCFVKEESMENI